MLTKLRKILKGHEPLLLLGIIIICIGCCVMAYQDYKKYVIANEKYEIIKKLLKDNHEKIIKEYNQRLQRNPSLRNTPRIHNI